MGTSAKRAAANEARFREANEQIRARAAQLELPEQPTPFLCECDDERCTTIVLLTTNEYEAVRSGPRTFLLTPGHQTTNDRVLEEHDGFTVVEKTGEEGRLVEEWNPRP